MLQVSSFQNKISKFIDDIQQSIENTRSLIDITEDVDDKDILVDSINKNEKQKTALTNLVNITNPKWITYQRTVAASQTFRAYYNRIIWPFASDGRTLDTDESTIMKINDEAIIVAKFLINILEQVQPPLTAEANCEIQQLSLIIKGASVAKAERESFILSSK